jgi:hypothetical protein
VTGLYCIGFGIGGSGDRQRGRAREQGFKH